MRGVIFVGGVYDGKRRVIEGAPRSVEIPHIRAFAAADYRAPDYAPMPVPVVRDEYTLRSIYLDGGGSVDFYALKDMPDKTAIQRVFSRYA